jgi:hypothetical protein
VRVKLPLICAFLALAGSLSAQSPATRPAPDGTDEPISLFKEPGGFTKGVTFAGRFLGDGGPADPANEAPKDGFFPELSNMITGGGWISVGPGYRHHLFGNRAVVETSAGLSWRAYKMAQASIETTGLAGGRVLIGSQLRWQDYTQITYFGEGPDAPVHDRSQYRLKATNVVGYGTVRVTPALSLVGRVGLIGRPSLQTPGGTFERDHPFSGVLFAGDRVFEVQEQPRFAHAEAGVVADTRDAPGHPSSGGIARAAWAIYSDRDAGEFSFSRFEAEAARFVRLGARSPVILAARGWLVASHTRDDQSVPFYLAPSLGGNNTIRSFSDYRFHDRHLLLVNAETRVAIFEHLDGVAFLDAGNVAPRLGDLSLDKVGYGLGVRVHSDGDTWARLDVGHGREGWHVWFRLNDPLGISRISRRTAPIPFAP